METETYDIKADAFYRMTGVMAPGKSVPIGMSQPTHGVRTELFRQWCETHNAAFAATYAACRDYWRIEDSKGAGR